VTPILTTYSWVTSRRSPRAAARLASIGFTRIYDYVAGKAEWAPLARSRRRRGWDTCFVVSDDRVVLGQLDGNALELELEALARA
jgi:hypothetical protein